MSGTDETAGESETPSSKLDAPAQADEEWRTPGRHYIVGVGCFGLVVLAVVGFYLWRFLG